MTFGACTAYFLIVIAVGFVLRKKWLPLAKQAWSLRQHQAWEASGVADKMRKMRGAKDLDDYPDYKKPPQA
jgi:hypothetical protein